LAKIASSASEKEYMERASFCDIDMLRSYDSSTPKEECNRRETKPKEIPGRSLVGVESQNCPASRSLVGD
jgi:hypothetical protein